jgi:ABC-type uncharacterized transport system involved in gliding motility auxiliary subunit
MANRYLDRQKLAAAGIGLAVVAFVGLNTWGSLDLRSERLDLTQHHQFTLSQGTERMLGHVGEPVTLRFYVSRAVREANPFLASYADRVHDMLKRYADASSGKVTVEYIDPEPFSQEEDRAVGFGLEAVQLDNKGSTGYFGIAGTNTTDDVDVLPVLSPERESFLEYDLTRMVYNLAHPEKPVVAVLGSLPLSGDPANQYQPWAVYKELGEFFQVRQLGGEVAKIDPDVKILMLVHPQGLDDKTLYAVDQFVMRGGKVLAMVDPHSEAEAMRQRQPGMGETASSLPKLFDAWGVELEQDKVVGDPKTARQVQYPSGGRKQVIAYLPWLSLDANNMNKGEVITAELNHINLASAGILKPKDGATTKLTPLLSSSRDAQEIAADKVRTYPDPFAIARDYKPGGQPLVMAARISGPVKSAFQAKPEGDNDGPDYQPEAKEPANIVVVADTDLLDDRTWLADQGMFGQSIQVPVADNAGFVANALDYLAGSDALTDLRGRDVSQRPFTRVAEIRQAAETQYRAKEQDLLQKLTDLQQKLSSARVDNVGDEAAIVTDQQKQEIEGFRGQLLDTRQQLRDVQLNLRKGIEDLQTRIRFFCIAAVPILVALVAIIVGLTKRARYRRRVDAAAHA